MGLSQQQLAGKEMTRAFISLVESNKCMPSPETLRIVAQRLGKPAEFFTQNDEPADDALDMAILLVESAERELDKQEPEATAAARRKLIQAIKRLAGTPNTDAEARARMLLVRCLELQNSPEETVDECEQALELYKQLNDTRGLARIYCCLGTAQYRLEEYAKARRAYEAAALYSSGMKNMQTFRAQVLSFLGTTLYRLGVYPEAVRACQEALTECPAEAPKEVLGTITMGLGWAHFRAGNVEAAQKWTAKAMEVLKAAKSAKFVLAQHNLAIIEAARNNWEKAYVSLQACLKIYREQGEIEQQVSAMEELARYWLHKGEPRRVETTCWEALDLLDLKDNSFLRGRLYRMLGMVAAAQGNLNEAHSMLHVSYELLRRLKSSTEANLSFEELQKVRQAITEAGGPVKA